MLVANNKHRHRCAARQCAGELDGLLQVTIIRGVSFESLCVILDRA